MMIGELARATGLTREALRFYESRGLIRARRMPNGYRDYPAETVMLVDYIRTARQLGFTLTEIGERMPEIWNRADAGSAIAGVLREKLVEIERRIVALQTLRDDLAARVGRECPLRVVPPR
ncbi:MAG: MerR family transcriptional regulator [Burkholderiaceae bacterium]|nr:MerR family transcriptional regulator [Burkholderiaceae bacterium]